MIDLDDLAEAARNRGLKLIRSRVRTPGKRRFGKVGLADGAGKPVFGLDDKGPIGRPEDVQQYLRTVGSADWAASVGSVRSRKRRRPAMPAPPPEPPPAPKPSVRQARSADAPALVALIRLVGADVDAAGVRKRLAASAKSAAPPLVATLGDEVVGLAGLNVMPTIHRDRPVGRINVLVVAESARGQGLGRMLVEVAERRLRDVGCGIIEVTSNDRLIKAHAFYRHLGYEQTSQRFCKSL